MKLQKSGFRSLGNQWGGGEEVCVWWEGRWHRVEANQKSGLVHLLSLRKRWQLVPLGTGNSNDVQLINARVPSSPKYGVCHREVITDVPTPAGETALGPLGARESGGSRNPGERPMGDPLVTP